MAIQVIKIIVDSNTSHVKVYRTKTLGNRSILLIQIHLMLKFIMLIKLGVLHQENSNTSHVKVYHTQNILLHNQYGNSNTSHVKVYPKRISQNPQALPNSNTSHVKVYQKCTAKTRLYFDIQIHLMLKFIFFSCPGLIFFLRFKYISC